MSSLSAFDLAPSRSLDFEWLMPNGAGGYSSSTPICMNTRKYHGFLVAPLKGVHSRHVMLSKFEESVRVGATEFSLSTNNYPGAVYPTGFRHQTAFSFTDHPIFSYSLNDSHLEKSVRILHGKNAVVVSYRVASGKEAHLEIRPQLSPRGIHQDRSAADAGQLEFEPDRYGFSIAKPAKMRVNCSHGKFTPEPITYRNMVYEWEKRRGYPYTEDLFSPGKFVSSLSRGEELHITSSLEGFSTPEALELLDRQSIRNRHLSESFCRVSGIERTDFSDALCQSADSFIFMQGNERGIIAGFHWFSEWGRDSMIALPGLLLPTGRHALARDILLKHASRMKGGLLPNFIDEDGKAHYTSSDASLWFINAVRQYAEYTGDYKFIQDSLWRALRAWLSATVAGNSLIRMESDGLLFVIEPASTWMDAKIDGKAVTPRRGKPVEINALWHSNLHFLLSLSEKFSDSRTAAQCSRILELATPSFQKFVSTEGWLLDVIEPNDASLRANQIFAVALPNSPLNFIQQKNVFFTVRSRLYTPLGLRTLAPTDSQYRSLYEGDQRSRDSAYHQGAIWPWLLGAFYDAQLSVFPGSERQVLSALKPFSEAMKQGCVGNIPELYNPEDMKSAGAVAQAWSVAEILRIYARAKKSQPESRPRMEWTHQVASNGF